MNNTIRQLLERKSVRSFTAREIDEETAREILLAAAAAPTAGNQQLYTILRVRDRGLLERLAKSCDHQPFIAEGKLVLVFCADCLKWYDAYRYAGCEPRRPGAGDLLLAVDDALIAAQNAVTAAESYGIGSCYIGDIMENAAEQRDILGLPESVFPAALVVFGSPTEQQKDREKPERADLKYIVNEDRYRRLGEEELRAMFEKRAGAAGYDAWMQAFCRRKYNSDFAREMTRSVEEFLEQYRP
ncbi:MAG: nitroreductase family protein [Lachnospiraceae bacterium]|nr:nitroreductase family protein [Lachnospiraceae bacterium]